MPLVDTTTLLRVADRAAYQYGQLKATCAAIQQQGTAYYTETITATDDPDVEIPCLQPYEEVDEDLKIEEAIKGTYLGLIVSGMIAHFNRRDANGDLLQVGGWDGYLTTKSERVSQYFGELFSTTGRGNMLAVNVFSEGDDTFADVSVIAGPNVVFVDGVNYGNGSALNPANGTYFAATQLRVVVVTKGATDLDLRLYVKDVNDNPATIDVTVPGGSAPGAVIQVGSASDRFLDVTGAGFNGSAGNTGDAVKIKNLKERQIAL